MSDAPSSDQLLASFNKSEADLKERARWNEDFLKTRAENRSRTFMQIPEHFVRQWMKRQDRRGAARYQPSTTVAVPGVMTVPSSVFVQISKSTTVSPPSSRTSVTVPPQIVRRPRKFGARYWTATETIRPSSPIHWRNVACTYDSSRLPIAKAPGFPAARPASSSIWIGTNSSLTAANRFHAWKLDIRSNVGISKPGYLGHQYRIPVERIVFTISPFWFFHVDSLTVINMRPRRVSRSW
jgi:hypothetical protein